MVTERDSDAGCEDLRRLAARMLVGYAAVRVTVTESTPDQDHVTFSAEGVADFADGRCSLVGADASVTFIRGTRYERLADGRWRRLKLDPGQWDALDPRWPLQALCQACGHADRVDITQLAVEFDRAQLSAITAAGLAAEWNATARVSLGSNEDIAETVVELQSETTPGAAVRMTFQFSQRADRPEAIEPPDPAATIDDAAYLDELLNRRT
jgi:hypothetical protein